MPRTQFKEFPFPKAKAAFQVQSKRIEELDGLRGLAAMMVVGYHYFYWWSERKPSGLWHVLNFLAQERWTGVNLFFVLSGFLITESLFRDARLNIPVREFYRSRIFRIFPAYYATLCVLIFLTPEKKFLALSAGFLAHAAPILAVAVPYPVLWTLGIEQHFYLVWPWVIRKLKLVSVTYVCLGVVIFEPALRALDFRYQIGGELLWANFDGLALGGLLAILRSHLRSHDRIKRVSMVLMGLAFALGTLGAPLGILTRSSLLGQSLQPTALDLFFGAVVAYATTCPANLVGTLLRSKPLKSLGAISYSLYLLHCLPLIFLGVVLRDRFGIASDSIFTPFFLLGLSVALSAASYRWIEIPGQKFGRTKRYQVAFQGEKVPVVFKA